MSIAACLSCFPTTALSDYVQRICSLDFFYGDNEQIREPKKHFLANKMTCKRHFIRKIFGGSDQIGTKIRY